MKNKPYKFIVILILLVLIALCKLFNLDNGFSFLLGFIFSYILILLLEFKKKYFNKNLSTYKLNSKINILCYMICLFVIVLTKNIFILLGFSCNVVIARLIIYKEFKKLICEEDCGCK